MANRSFSRMESTCLEDEIDFLSAVFFEELQISDENTPQNEKVIFLNLEPSTADDKTKQFVFVKLKVVIPTDYPSVSPIWTAVNTRGLSDELLNNLLMEARLISESKIGHSMLYEVIEQLKVYLTEQNKPYEACCVCMCEFDTDHGYTKTDCFHFFHLECFASYVEIEFKRIRELETEIQVAGAKREKSQLECPVCRKVLTADSQCMEDVRGIDSRSFFTTRSSSPVFKPTREMMEQQAMRAELFQRQKAAGGIIDLKEEAARFDMDSNWRPPTPDREVEAEIVTTEVMESKNVDEEMLVFSKIETEEVGKEIDTQALSETSKQTNTTTTTTTTTTTRQTSHVRDKQSNKQSSGYRRDNNYNDYRDKPRDGYRQERDRGYNRPSYQQERDKECSYNYDSRPPYQQDRDKECSYNYDSRPSYQQDRDKECSYNYDSRPSYQQERDKECNYNYDSRPPYQQDRDKECSYNYDSRLSYQQDRDKECSYNYDSRPSYQQDRDKECNYNYDSRPSYQQDRDKECSYNYDRPSYQQDRDKQCSYNYDSRPSYQQERDKEYSYNHDSRPPYQQDRDKEYSYNYDRPSYQQDRDKECSYNGYKPRFREYTAGNKYYNDENRY